MKKFKLFEFKNNNSMFMLSRYLHCTLLRCTYLFRVAARTSSHVWGGLGWSTWHAGWWVIWVVLIICTLNLSCSLINIAGDLIFVHYFNNSVMDQIMCTSWQINFQIFGNCKSQIGMNTTANKLHHNSKKLALTCLTLNLFTIKSWLSCST